MQRAAWVVLGMAWAGCGNEERLGRVDDGWIQLVRGHLDVNDDWQIQLEFAGDPERCLGLSKNAVATVDGLPMEMVWQGGWGHDPISFLETCTISRFWLDNLPMDPEIEVSTVVIEDRGARVEFEVPHLRVPHEIRWIEPQDGVLAPQAEASLEVVPARDDVPFDPINSVLFTPEGGQPSFEVCTEENAGGWCASTTLAVDGSRASLVTPDFCDGGAWRMSPPALAPKVGRAQGFAVSAWLGIDSVPVEVALPEDAPPCDLPGEG